ncbi:nuclear transport factor 2 family protein [uncultured Algibacter sp.]|uniref:nuclear transport factor 2 family protein n=1 Tax=uncultured Algibacter sp. TaxID=298659 RepID=UPI002616144E|nr:nuclear transport factor 2 family protein [uncultured Algibacter sp.]
MKKHVLIVMLLSVVLMYSQKKEKNGTVYKEHPAIVTVEAFQQADVKGDVDAVSSYLADDFKAYNGTSRNKDAKGTNKEDYLKWVENRSKWTAYRSLSRHGEAYPDAIEYKDGKTWVQTWDYLKGVNDATGVKIEMPVHNLYKLNDDGKIEMAIYYNYPVGNDIRSAYSTRKNGVLYNEHKYINKVRRMVAAFENKDLEKAYSYFDENVSISNLEMGLGESIDLDELKTRHQEFFENFEIESIDVVGYPDGLEYEIGNGFTVQSWWNFRLVRKSDNKKIVMPAMYTHDFNDEGLISRSIGYFSTKVLEAK